MGLEELFLDRRVMKKSMEYSRVGFNAMLMMALYSIPKGARGTPRIMGSKEPHIKGKGFYFKAQRAQRLFLLPIILLSNWESTTVK